jgi:hypothetical protein
MNIDTTSENWQEIRRLEEVIRQSENDVEEIARKAEDELRHGESIGLLARWKSGQQMSTLKRGRKQLPPGVVKELAAALERDPSEVRARMKFAELYRTEEEVSHVVRELGSWHQIRKHGLKNRRQEADGTVTDAEPVTETAPTTTAESSYSHSLQRVLDFIENIDSAELTQRDLELLAQVANRTHRLQDAVVTLVA